MKGDRKSLEEFFEILKEELEVNGTVSMTTVGDLKFEVQNLVEKAGELVKQSRDKELRILEEYERTRQGKCFFFLQDSVV